MRDCEPRPEADERAVTLLDRIEDDIRCDTALLCASHAAACVRKERPDASPKLLMVARLLGACASVVLCDRVFGVDDS